MTPSPHPTSALPAPRDLCRSVPLASPSRRHVDASRRAIADLLAGRDSRLLVIAGPCSIHDPSQALEYADRLARLAERHASELLIVMRAYFEKPRTTVGWKGWLYDPHLDGTEDLAFGLASARRLLTRLAERGLPVATELVDPSFAPFLEDLLSFAVIGARTVESPVHRQLASGLALPVGFKNGTSGDVSIAADAVVTAAAAHRFLAPDGAGRLAVRSTSGNPDTCVILRGGPRPNFTPRDVAAALERLPRAPARPLVVDCSHGNSGKDHTRQSLVWRAVLDQVGAERRIAGLMLESHLRPGRQSREAGRPLAHGVSITDACIGWQETEQLIAEAALRRGGSKPEGRASMLA